MSGFEPDCPVLGRLVRLKISAQTKPDTDIQIYTYVYRSRPSIFGSRTELGNRSRVSTFFDVPTWQPRLQVERSGQIARSINAKADNAPHLPKGRPTKVNLGTGME